MAKSYKSHSFINGLKFSCLKSLRENRMKIILSVLVALVAIFTGIFVAIKSNNNCTLSTLREICLGDFYNGIVGTSSAFTTRTLSLVINICLLSVIAFVKPLFPLAGVLFAYRGYLFGVNFALVFIFYGIGSIVTAVVVILPCQLLTLLVMILFYIVFLKINADCKKFGRCDCNRLLFFFFGLCALLAINIIETFLLFVLQGSVVFVI